MPRDCTALPRERFGLDEQSRSHEAASNTLMTTKNEATPEKVVKEIVEIETKKRNRRRRRARPYPRLPRGNPWISALSSALTASPCHIPDQETTGAATCFSYQVGTFVPQMLGGTSATHTSAIFVAPHPQLAFGLAYQLNSSSALIDAINTAGTTTSWSAVPNLTSLTGGSTVYYGGKVRCTGIEMCLTYEGTELNRSASIISGYTTIDRLPDVLATTGTVDLLVSAIGNGSNNGINVVDLKNALVRPQTYRMPSNGSLKFRWVPSGVPVYQPVNQANLVPFTGRTAGTSGTTSAFYCASNEVGLEAGASVMTILIENDTVSSAAALGNAYNYEIRWLWELIPDQPNAVMTPVTPSPAHQGQVDAALNYVATMPICVPVNGRSF